VAAIAFKGKKPPDAEMLNKFFQGMEHEPAPESIPRVLPFIVFLRVLIDIVGPGPAMEIAASIVRGNADLPPSLARLTDSMRAFLRLQSDGAPIDSEADRAWEALDPLARVGKLIQLPFAKDLVEQSELARRIIEGGRLANEKTYGTREQKEAARAEWQRVIDELYEEDQGRNFKELLALASERVRQPNGKPARARTIRRYVKNPRKESLE
jgi:hypothetical protein